MDIHSILNSDEVGLLDVLRIDAVLADMFLQSPTAGAEFESPLTVQGTHREARASRPQAITMDGQFSPAESPFAQAAPAFPFSSDAQGGALAPSTNEQVHNRAASRALAAPATPATSAFDYGDDDANASVFEDLAAENGQAPRTPALHAASQCFQDAHSAERAFNSHVEKHHWSTRIADPSFPRNDEQDRAWVEYLAQQSRYYGDESNEQEGPGEPKWKKWLSFVRAEAKLAPSDQVNPQAARDGHMVTLAAWNWLKALKQHHLDGGPACVNRDDASKKLRNWNGDFGGHARALGAAIRESKTLCLRATKASENPRHVVDNVEQQRRTMRRNLTSNNRRDERNRRNRQFVEWHNGQDSSALTRFGQGEEASKVKREQTDEEAPAEEEKPAKRQRVSGPTAAAGSSTAAATAAAAPAVDADTKAATPVLPPTTARLAVRNRKKENEASSRGRLGARSQAASAAVSLPAALNVYQSSPARQSSPSDDNVLVQGVFEAAMGPAGHGSAGSFSPPLYLQGQPGHHAEHHLGHQPVEHPEHEEQRQRRTSLSPFSAAWMPQQASYPASLLSDPAFLGPVYASRQYPPPPPMVPYELQQHQQPPSHGPAAYTGSGYFPGYGIPAQVEESDASTLSALPGIFPYEPIGVGVEAWDQVDDEAAGGEYESHD